MYLEGERRDNELAYRQLKPLIDQQYPKGRYIALAQGEIVADGATFEELNALLNARGRASECIFIVQAGEEYPDDFEFPGMRLVPVPKRDIVLTPEQQEAVQRHHDYAWLKPYIDRSYPHNQFVAVENDEVVADAVGIEELLKLLEAKGRNSRSVMIIQAGYEALDYGVIL